MAPTRPPPPVLRRSGFIVRGETFGVENHPRVKGTRLNELFSPQHLKEKWQRQFAADDARDLFKKPFFAAQLRYYGIVHPAKASVSDLKNLLKEAVAAGKCENVADDVVELERSMKAEYEPIFRVWDAELKVIEHAAWAKRETPTERAEMDSERFISDYFLTDDGKPDPSKTKEPIALSVTKEYSPLYGNLTRTVFKTPGLHLRSGGRDLPSTIYIGWDRDEVTGLALKATEEADRLKQAELEGRWDKTLEKHTLLTEQFIGSYVLRCKEIEKQWPPTENLTLDIALGSLNNILEAAMNLSMLEGTMLLALSESVLDQVAPSEEVPEFDEEEEGSGGEQESGPSSSGKRGAPAMEIAPGRPSKKTKADIPERRIFVRVTGRETGEGEVFSYPERGYLDFTDDTYTAFTGVLDLPHVGVKIPIEGRKVFATPKRRPEPWAHFAGGRYGYE